MDLTDDLRPQHANGCSDVQSRPTLNGPACDKKIASALITDGLGHDLVRTIDAPSARKAVGRYRLE